MQRPAVILAGTRAGDTVVQMYIHHEISSVVQPVMMLKGFQRVHLNAGESKQIDFHVGHDELAIIDLQMKYRVQTGQVDILVGENAANTEAVHLTVKSD
jgi:beta-glucosidase